MVFVGRASDELFPYPRHAIRNAGLRTNKKLALVCFDAHKELHPTMEPIRSVVELRGVQTKLVGGVEARAPFSARQACSVFGSKVSPTPQSFHHATNY